MSKGLPLNVRSNLEKCREATIAAVEAYNRPGPRFRTAQYLVMIVIAWTALFHAIFYKRRRRPWYVKPKSGTGKAIRYQKIDGEPRHWELGECLNQYYGGQNPPERKNLEFLIGLRNKIEHRHLPELDASLYGECQAALLNLEALLVSEFGRKYALEEQLAVSLQFSQVIPHEKRSAVKELAKSQSKSVIDYVEKFRGRLSGTVLNSIRYSFSVFLVPKVANRERASDIAVQFVKIDEASEEELDRLDKLNVLIKEKHIPIANLNLHRPSQVVKIIENRLPFKFNMHIHTKSWRYFGVRPATDSKRPEETTSQYCVFDRVHSDYVYTQAWIELLIRELSDPVRYELIVGEPPT